MTTPADERPEPTYALPSYVNAQSQERSSDEEVTIVGENNGSFHDERKERHATVQDEPPAEAPRTKPRNNSHLTVDTQADFEPGDPLRNMQSPSRTREAAYRLDDELAMLKVERQVSRIAEELEMDRMSSNLQRTRSKRDDTLDEFDIATNPIHEKTALYKPPAHPIGSFSKFIKRIHNSSWIIRYFTYISPVVLILLIPLLLGALKFPNASVGKVQLVWFMIWLEIVWLTLWAGRMFAKTLPWPIGLLASPFTNNSKKWRDMAKQLELPATLFFWWLGIEVSFLPIMIHHQVDGLAGTREWMNTTNKVLVSLFVGAVVNFFEKIVIQLIAISFHLRTYADRIELNKFQIGSLTKLYTFSKEKIAMEDSEFELKSGQRSGARTPGQYLQEAQKRTVQGMKQFGDVAGKIAGDFTGRRVNKSTHPHQVILTLLNSTAGSQVLARRLYRTFARPETETIHSDDLKDAFDNDDEADAAFSMFDKDMNGDISMEELESVCVEIGRERKSITASLKDLDSVVGKLDEFLMFVVAIITLLVFVSLISTSAAGVLTSLGSTVLALSWLLQATAQEFLQSCIFVFVKHPFDVGDRVSIYGNTGSLMRGDDYFVKEISLLYTEFKKMEGHVVQAPNSYLNTLFIMNQRRSGGLAEAVSITIKFGTTLDQIDGLRQRLLEFVKQERREYQGNILTELRDIVEAHSINLNVIFFYKSNWQNEGLRLARRNKFICAMMVTMQELGIEGPRMRFPGQKESFPVYLQQIPHMSTPGMGRGGHPDNPTGWQPQEESRDPPFVAPPSPEQQQQQQSPIAPGGLSGLARHPTVQQRGGSILRQNTVRPRRESLSAMNRRVDFSLGVDAFAAGNMSGDVFADRERGHVPIGVTEASQSRARSSLDSNEMARTTSRASDVGPGNLARRSTDLESRVSRTGVHRNRFFGRHRAGTLDEHMLAEHGMADIPEGPGEIPPNAPNYSNRLDPRTGLVSSAAWRVNTDESNGKGPPLTATVSDPLEPSVSPRATHAPPRSGTITQDFEMRQMK